MNKKAQAISIIFFFVAIVGLFIVSIVILRMTNVILTPFQAQIGNMSSTAGTTVTSIQSSFVRWWDPVIVLLFVFQIVLLLISAFLIDIHPAFILVYILSVFFLFIMGNFALSALDSIWEVMATATELAQTPLQQFIINHFGITMLGVVILSGVVMYAKIKLFGGSQSGNS